MVRTQGPASGAVVVEEKKAMGRPAIPQSRSDQAAGGPWVLSAASLFKRLKDWWAHNAIPVRNGINRLLTQFQARSWA